MSVTPQQLHEMEDLKNVPLDQLQWLIDQSTCRWYEEGDELFKIGDAIDATHVLLEGRIRICVLQSGKMRQVAVLDQGTVTGYLPFSRAVTVMATGECMKRTHVLTCPAEAIKKGAHMHYELTEALVHLMTSRVRNFTVLQQQDEKLISLGKLSAGLAHELNNPAAAIARTASMLEKQVTQLTGLFKPLTQLQLSSTQLEMLDKKVNKLVCAGPQPVKSMLQRAADEEELYSWLQEEQVDVDELPSSFAEAGIAVKDLNEIKQYVPSGQLPLLLEWIHNGTLVMKMANEIQDASNRISDLVNSVKNYTQMDRAADMQPVDVHAGIRNTLTMLGYKLRKGNIHVVEDFDLSLPSIMALPGELNQVWTNVIDNAIDAMAVNGEGTLQIATQKDKTFIEVSITDNGPGIPAEIQAQVFDPFFTTKEVGKGTGLGLDIVQRIMRQYRGSVHLKSVPGKTTFILSFPVNQD